MTSDEIEHNAIETIREIAAMAGTASGRSENPGAVMMAILLTAYSKAVYEMLLYDVITLAEAQSAVAADFGVIQERLLEVEALRVR